MADAVELTILMPCLNEAESLAFCIRKAHQFIARYSISGEVLIADNGSTDGSVDIALSEGARVVHVPTRGYGAALFGGVNEALGRCVIMGDADGSYDFERLDLFVDALRRGADLVIGNRFSGGIAPGAMPLKNRYFGNPVLSAIGRTFFRCPVGDFHCGLRGFSREAFFKMRLQTTGMEFASEMAVKATLLGMRVEEVPTTLSKDLRNRPPHLRPWRDGWRHLRFMLLFSPRWLFLYPGLLLMIAGAVVAAAVLPAPLVLTARLGLDVHTLLFAFTAVIIGFQAVSFAFFARIYALQQGLLPGDPSLEKLLSWFTLELGLFVGIALVLFGAGGAIATVVGWWNAGFGELNPRDTLRTAIPAVSAVCLGVQVVLSSFLMSVLGLRRR